MTTNQFNEAVDEIIGYSMGLMKTKADEYTEGGRDPLSQFKKGAAMRGHHNTKDVLFGMYLKHVLSLSDMCQSGHSYDRERWREKITDSINYLLLLWGLVSEEGLNDRTDG